MLIRLVALAAALCTIVSTGRSRAQEQPVLELLDSPESDDAGSAAGGVFLAGAGMQFAGNWGLWGIDRAGGEMELLVPLTLAWPSVSALVAWAVGETSDTHESSYGAMMLGSYLGLVVGSAVGGIVMSAIIAAGGLGTLTAALLVARIIWTVGPAAGMTIGFVSTREPLERARWEHPIAR